MSNSTMKNSNSSEWTYKCNFDMRCAICFHFFTTKPLKQCTVGHVCCLDCTVRVNITDIELGKTMQCAKCMVCRRQREPSRVSLPMWTMIEDFNNRNGAPAIDPQDRQLHMEMLFKEFLEFMTERPTPLLRYRGIQNNRYLNQAQLTNAIWDFSGLLWMGKHGDNSIDAFDSDFARAMRMRHKMKQLRWNLPQWNAVLHYVLDSTTRPF